MKTKSLLSVIAAVSMMAVVSCEREILPIDTSEQTTPEVKTYSMTITAGKGGMQTKALSVSDHVLSATWTKGDVVTVYKGDTEVGTLTAQSSGVSTTLTGDITGAINVDDVLTLKFLSANYDSQGGTLAYIAEHCDFAVAEVKVASTDGGKITTTAAADFVNQQAIVQFTLKTYKGEASQYLNNLSIGYSSEALSGTIGLTGCQSAVSTNGNGIVYVAIPAVLNATVNLSAEVISENDRYFYEKSGISFGRGRYYEIGVKMSHVLFITTEGFLRSNMNTASNENFTLLLKNDITIANGEIPANYNQTINLNGHTISVKSGKSNRIFNVPAGRKLTITGGGTLTGGSADNGGAIYNSGTLIINDVTVNSNTATGHGGAIYNDGTLTINGGVISNNTGSDAGAIYNASGKTLTINGGTFSNNTATTYSGGAVVNEGTATIAGGTFTGNAANVNGGAIYNYGTLTMTGGEVSGNTAPVGDGGNGGGVYIHENGGDLYMSGNPQIYDNSSNNLYLGQNKVITVNEKFEAGANISVTRYDHSLGAFTTGYKTNNPDKLPQLVFSADNAGRAVTLASNEGAMKAYDPSEVTGSVTYLDMWETNRGEKTIAAGNYTKMSNILSSGNYTLSGSDTWYVVDKNLTFNNPITIQANATVNLLLMDNTFLVADKGIYVNTGASLHIWAQSTKTAEDDCQGMLRATSNRAEYSGIGGRYNAGDGGHLYFHGGIIGAVGGKKAAGIKGAPIVEDEHFTMNFYGATVIAMGGDYGAGIGSGFTMTCGGILITGGGVTGIGGLKAAGIGSGYAGKMHYAPKGYSGNPTGDSWTTIRITGGVVWGWGMSGAGIGGGEKYDTYDGNPAITEILGGTITAMTTDGQPLNSGGAVAIGGGCFAMQPTGYLKIYDEAKVSGSPYNNVGPTLKTFTEGRDPSKFKQMKIELCDHPGQSHGATCPYCNQVVP